MKYAKNPFSVPLCGYRNSNPYFPLFMAKGTVSESLKVFDGDVSFCRLIYVGKSGFRILRTTVLRLSQCSFTGVEKTALAQSIR